MRDIKLAAAGAGPQPRQQPHQQLAPRIGEVFFSTGNSYRGEMVDGMMHGSGVYSWADGSRYVGEFSANEIQGSGEKTWEGGKRRYTGQWEAGVFHGKGHVPTGFAAVVVKDAYR